MRGDGNGWAACGMGHRQWGWFGAAGLLVVRTVADGREVLLQQRAAWTSEGGTWSIPGGARDSHETPQQAAMREAAEEAGIRADDVLVAGLSRDDHGGWAYTTVIATPVTEFKVTSNNESVEQRWVRTVGVGRLRLHPGFARTWPHVRSIMDAATRPVTS